MDNRGFWSDTLRGGAWLGLLMGLSAVLETYGMFLSMIYSGSVYLS